MPDVQAWELKAKIFEKKCLAAEKAMIKSCSPKEAASLKTQMKTNRKAAYDKEDKMAETIPAAIKKGVTGKKWKDFVKDTDFKKAMTDWEAALAHQQNLVKSLEWLSETAKKTHQDLKRAQADFEKEIKKTGESVKSNKTLKTVLEKSQAVLKQLDEAQGAFGTLSAKEAFFGANVKKSKDAVVSKALKDGSGDELPDILLENAKRQQSDTTAKRLARNVEKHVGNIKTLCAKEKFASVPDDVSARKALERDVQNARSSLKQASDHLDKLQSLNKDLQAAKKKQAKLIAAHNEKAKMTGLIDSVADKTKISEAAYNAAEDLIEDADTAL